jgi:hypothetical protein
MRRTLGEETFGALMQQLGDVQSRFGPDSPLIRYLVSIPAAEAAAMVTRQLQDQFPENPIANWPLERQLSAVYSILACEHDKYFSDADAEIDFASDLEIRDVAHRFHDFPVRK